MLFWFFFFRIAQIRNKKIKLHTHRKWKSTPEWTRMSPSIWFNASVNALWPLWVSILCVCANNKVRKTHTKHNAIHTNKQNNTKKIIFFFFHICNMKCLPEMHIILIALLFLLSDNNGLLPLFPSVVISLDSTQFRNYKTKKQTTKTKFLLFLCPN